MITRLLIANRGEIACRVIKTARRMGMVELPFVAHSGKLEKHGNIPL